MVIVPYSQFGLADPDTYRLYLLAFRDGVGRDFLVGRQGVQGGNVAGIAAGSDGDRLLRETEAIGAVDAVIARYIDGKSRRGDCGFAVGGDVGAAAVRVSYVSRGAGDGDAGVDFGGGCARGGAGGDSSYANGPVELERVVDAGFPREGGKWRRKNQKKKEKKKMDSSKGEFVGEVKVAGSVVKNEARETLEAKWVIENKLAKLRAEQELEIAMKRDLLKEAKKREVETMRRTESAKVAVEKSFATLRRTGNVVGHCETVVSGVPGLSDGSSSEGDCTISPDSSISRAEVQEMQKQLLDFQKRAEDAEKLLKRREIMDKATYAQSMAEFTAGSESVMSEGLKCELDRKFGESYEYEGKFDGKHVVRKVFHDGGMNVEDCEDFGDIY